MFSRMDMFCPICRGTMDGMRAYGRWHCCDKDCHDEAEWRNVLAIMGKPYEHRKDSKDEKEGTEARGI